MKNVFLWAVILILPLSSFGFTTDGEFGKVVNECGTKNPKKHVWIFKQWHLSPSVNTFAHQDNLPQGENQRAIFKQLARWINQGDLDTIYSEGCSDEITDHFSKSFNGWNFDSLSSKAKDKKYDDKDYSDILTLIPLKLKAMFRDKVHVYCGDDETIIKKQGEALSDARGNAGFLTRIQQFHDDPQRIKPYLDKVIELDHLPPKTNSDGAIKRLKGDLAEEIIAVKKGIDDRNKSFVDALARGPSDSALVVGGIHASGIMGLLKVRDIGCTVVEPKGYRAEDEKALSNFLEPDHK